jgi:DNA repair protein RecO (recombination protein O)
MAMKSYKARGVVLHTIKYGDTGMVAWVLTDVGGRLTYMVQGVCSARGRGNRAALLQPMFLVEFEGLSSPRAEMHRFREMRAAVALRTVPFDVRKSTVSLFMAEMVYRLVREVEVNSPLFKFVWGAVCELDALVEASDVANFHLRFMVGLSRHLGIYPGNEWSAGWWFDIREGLFTPWEPRHGVCFTPENAALLGRLMEIEQSRFPAFDGTDWTGVGDACGVCGEGCADNANGAGDANCTGGEGGGVQMQPLALNRTRRTEFMNAMLAYFGYHLDAVRDIRSVDILREVF